MGCTNGCVINTMVGGDHAYCSCDCHEDTLPAEAPSRERLPKVEELVSEAAQE